MGSVTIEHDAEQFRHHLALHLDDADHGGVMAAVDVTTREDAPDELLAIVQDFYDPRVWYSTGKPYSKYQHALAAIGATLDSINPSRSPLSERWTR